MALSPEYGWPEPDNSSLVKNGAQDIRALGDAIDTSVWNVGYGQAGKNKIINGNFAINQRAFSSTTSSATFTFDRYKTEFSGGTVTYSAQTFTPGAAPVAGYESTKFLQVVTSGQSGANFALIDQKIEDVRTFAGQTVTISFWAKVASGTGKVGVAFEQNFGSGGSGTVVLAAGDLTAITTSWARYTVTAAISSVSGKTIGASSFLRLCLFTSAGTAVSSYSSIGVVNQTIGFWGVQVEYGSKATPFQTASGSIAGELALAQRYYYRQGGAAVYQEFGFGSSGGSTTGANVQVQFPVTMRTNPSAIDFSTLALTDYNGNNAITTAVFGTNSPNMAAVTVGGTSGLTTYRPYALRANNSTSAYIGFTAELQEMKMDNVTFIEVNEVEHAIIDRGNGEFTSMLKSTYDAMQAEQSTPIVTDEAEAI